MAESKEPFLRRALEAVVIAIFVIIAEGLVRKIGEIDVSGAIVCPIIHLVFNDPLRFGC